MAIATPTIAVDHVTASVIQGALENIAVEMGYKLMRMSYSSIIRHSRRPCSRDPFRGMSAVSSASCRHAGRPWRRVT